jgi:hypothetical protein
MQSFEFYGEPDYVEYFWNHIPGKKELGKIYTHVITSTDAREWDNLHPGDTLHMMASKPARESADYWMVSSAISDCIDDTELNAKVAKLVAVGARYVDMNADWGHAIAIRTYDELVKINSTPNQDYKYDELQQIDQVRFNRENVRKLNFDFVANARVFSDDELVIIAEHKRAEEAFYGLFKRVD